MLAGPTCVELAWNLRPDLIVQGTGIGIAQVRREGGAKAVAVRRAPRLLGR